MSTANNNGGLPTGCGDYRRPVLQGSGGRLLSWTCCSAGAGGAGGAALHIVSQSATVDGYIGVNGANGARGYPNWRQPGGGGAGGSILVEVSDLSGSGVFSSNGGNGGVDGSSCGGGGSGGRVAVYASSSSFSGTFTAFGGSHSSDEACRGPAGSIFTSLGGQEQLTIDNNGYSQRANSPVISVLACNSASQCEIPKLDLTGAAHVGPIWLSGALSTPVRV